MLAALAQLKTTGQPIDLVGTRKNGVFYVDVLDYSGASIVVDENQCFFMFEFGNVKKCLVPENIAHSIFVENHAKSL